jgi:hypothetical protein
LIYWFVSFTQKEVERQQISPQMRRILTTLAGTAHATRVRLDESGKTARPKDEID